MSHLALKFLQASFLATLPTVEEVRSGKHVVKASRVMLIVGRKDEAGQPKMFAAGPFPVAEIEWARLADDDRVYEGDDR